MTTSPFPAGVAEVIYNDFSGKDPFLFGDIGVLLGRAIKKSPLATKIPLLRANETIRATVVGAGSHTTEISGSTITWKDVELPLKNIPILKLSPTDEEAISQTVAGRLSWFDTDLIALGLRGPKSPTFSQVERYAEEIVRGLAPFMEKGLPLLVVCENDFAKVLGQAMLSYYPKILCIDNIKVENGDYIDIGVPVPGAGVIPVVIKTLVLASPAMDKT